MLQKYIKMYKNVTKVTFQVNFVQMGEECFNIMQILKRFIWRMQIDNVSWYRNKDKKWYLNVTNLHYKYFFPILPEYSFIG